MSARVSLRPVADPASVAADWRALEPRADASFFQSWTWVGCLASERFGDAWLLRVEQAGALVGLALLNHTRRRTRRPPGQRRLFGERLWLGESGDPALDCVHVEHNGPLLARGHAGLLPACLRALLAPSGWPGRILRLSGVDAAHLAAARAAGAARLLRRQPAPFVDLAALGGSEGAYLASLSANTRQQLRRSGRAYAAIGPPGLRRAATLDEALDFLDALAALHQAAWAARGQPGAFARPGFMRFHRELLARAMPRGEADLLRVTAGDHVVGYLYNFRHRGRVLAYQSGFAYAGAPRHGKPGLTCHHAAIAQARRDGMTRYDFLAGGDRYKTSLANAAATLHWLEAAPRWSLSGLALWGRGIAGDVSDAIRQAARAGSARLLAPRRR